MDSLDPSFAAEPDPAQEVQRLIGEIARRHKIVLGPGDPMFVMLSLLELAVNRYLEKADEVLSRQREASVAVIERAAAAAKGQAEVLITSAAGYVAKQVKGSIAELSEALTKEAAAERARIGAAAKNARRALWAASLVLAVLFSILIGIVIGTWLAPEVKERVWRCPGFAASGVAPKAPLPAKRL